MKDWLYTESPEEIKETYQKMYEGLGFYYVACAEEKEVGKSYEHKGGEFTFQVLREATYEERDKFYRFVKAHPTIDDNFPYRYIISID